MIHAKYSMEEFKKQPETFRIEAVISDGMWYSLPKWRKIAKVSEAAINEWIKEHLANGMLLQSETGAQSYRFPLTSIKKWYSDNDLYLGDQLIDFLFPPRIWGGKTETEGFLDAPLREISIVSFSCSSSVAEEVTEKLRGIARVRETEPNHYKAYCLDAASAKEIVVEAFRGREEQHIGKIYSRAVAKRRELVDFPDEFSHGLVVFYKNFGKTLVKPAMETIRIFLSEAEDQDTQIVMWVIAAIEKFDESTSVPFSGYLNSVLNRWPYDLPYTHLGKELSNFQRQRAKALDALKKKTKKTEFTHAEIAEAMKADRAWFDNLEEKHRMWLSAKSATTLTWAENSEEKGGVSVLTEVARPPVPPTDIALANRLSLALVQTAIVTENFDDAFSLMSQIDASDINLAKIREVSEEFIQALGAELGIVGG